MTKNPTMADKNQPENVSSVDAPVTESKAHVGKKILAQALLIGAAVKSAFTYLKDPKNKETALEQTDELEEKVHEKTAQVTHVAEDVKKKAGDLKEKAKKAVAAAKGGKKTVKAAAVAVVAEKSSSTATVSEKATPKKSTEVKSAPQKGASAKAPVAKTAPAKKEAPIKKATGTKEEVKSKVVKKTK